MKRAVTVVGAGPAGLTLANLIQQSGIDCVVLEKASRTHVETRPRAGVLEHRSVTMLESLGLADRLLMEADRHGTCEFRVSGQVFQVSYSDLYGGREHYVYPQQEVVKDLIGGFLAAGGDIRFSVSDVELRDLTSSTPSVAFTSADGSRETVTSDFVAGCDGFHGVSRPSIPQGVLTEFTHQHGIEWLAILAEAPPSTKAIIYALHEDGFAGHMLRSPSVSRFYLQVPVGTKAEDWSDEQVWEALHKRFALHDSSWTLTEGKIIEKRVLDMRSHVVEPMSYGRLYLLGDAAHIITPVGAKGMNLAMNDAATFGRALVDYYSTGSETGLKTYSEDCLRRVWRAQEFSQWMVNMIHTDVSSPFFGRLAQARLEHLAESPAYRATFAENYVGP
ncbi:4-hydroxybenzoate 3-monooxygenase [Lentzea sp. DG1S-22]|uniref:4-hydroxybenzoate 3-monooxygenase n=1 Tax=Lentzea sp. DG1S-22 TaxID=3108822 RepID=UPI002E791FF4|nr:4-hydroxybenzoate 3-monooxygenase [Lentzea sp. DG1S-22]WVH80759.1 4-hydroxybenzoate 3-monooxygenase [Lentzea sp. DG1S-22]